MRVVRLTDHSQVVAKCVPRDPPVLFIHLHDRIDVKKSSFRVASMKIELTLAKAVPGKWPDFGTQSSSMPQGLIGPGVDDDSLLTWLALSAPNLPTAQEPVVETHGEPSTETTSASGSGPKEAASSKASTKAPAYPTSSKSGPKDWDNIGADDDDEDNPGDVDNFFKKLFKDSTPEQQRAMMKSYTESNGTALSTDWSSVAKGKVETQPPTGMEAKKWGA